jgi:hypothetical protein
MCLPTKKKKLKLYRFKQQKVESELMDQNSLPHVPARFCDRLDYACVWKSQTHRTDVGILE